MTSNRAPTTTELNNKKVDTTQWPAKAHRVHLVDSNGTPDYTRDFMTEVAKGNVPGHSAINKFGHNEEVATGTDPEDVWVGAGLYAFYPTTAQNMEIVSDSVEDDAVAVGTGAWTVVVYGLDANWEYQEETVTLDGTTPVALANTYIRMYRAVVITAGTSGSNVGNLTVRIVTVGTVAIYIASTDGQTQQAIFTVPKGHTAYFVKGYVGVSKGGGATVYEALFKWKLRLNTVANGAWQTKGQISCITHGSSWWQYEYGIPAGAIPEKTDIRIECNEVTGTLGVVGGFDLLLVEDGY